MALDASFTPSPGVPEREKRAKSGLGWPSGALRWGTDGPLERPAVHRGPSIVLGVGLFDVFRHVFEVRFCLGSGVRDERNHLRDPSAAEFAHQFLHL